MYYKELTTNEMVSEEDAFLYAKENLDYLEGKDKKEFLDWFFSGNWVKEDSNVKTI
ncbi:hypothetical protein [Robinsoniella peoriensis]|uniref:hypothetical protein n=1 Tax=Robinsoniella peoriensis TaxID=180332 RepID=UPI00375171D5